MGNAPFDAGIAFSYSSGRMSRLLWLTILLAATLGALPAAGGNPVARVTLSDDLAAISRFLPAAGRLPRGERAPRLDRGASELPLGRRIPPSISAQSDFQHSFSSCLRVDLPGQDQGHPDRRRAHRRPAGRRAGTGRLSLRRPGAGPHQRGKGGDPPLSLTVLFLGAEYGEGDAYPMGSTLFLRDFQPDYRTAVVYLKLRAGAFTGPRARGRTGYREPVLADEQVRGRPARRPVPFLLRGDEAQVFRMGTTNERTLIEPCLPGGLSLGRAGGGIQRHRGRHRGAWLTALSAFLRGFLTRERGGHPRGVGPPLPAPADRAGCPSSSAKGPTWRCCWASSR